MKSLIIVSNRLFFSIKPDLSFSKSPGGLVSGIKTFLKKAEFIKDYIWIGWPGASFDKKKAESVRKKAKRLKCHPVFIPSKQLDKFYNGFCNKILWPLFHGFASYAVYDKSFWENYVAVNNLFCEEVTKYINSDSTVWIHDYHLMLLPSMLRNLFSEITIGFFLHIPFPPPEIFMQLPWRKEILEGLLGCDLIGFHTHEYTINFLRTLSRTLGIEHQTGGLLFYQDRVIKVDTFPMGIDFDLFYNACERKKIKSISQYIKKKLKGKKIIFSADRLDYTKGLYNKLLAFEELLIKRPDFHEKVVFIMVVVPSREGVDHYQRMKKQLEEKISEINGKFGKIGWTPILYYYKLLNFEELVGHYLATDVILVTPLKDGMNLIAKEFVASRKDQRGVIILSEFAGSAKELKEALIVNPNSISELSNALEKALELPEEEQRVRILFMQENLKKYDIISWGKDFLYTLNSLKEEKKKSAERLLSVHLKKIKELFEKALNRIIFLDYDGTLVPIVSKPHLAVPDNELKRILINLSSYPNTEVVITSGRKKEDLLKWFDGIRLNFISEHGIFIKKSEKDWESLIDISPDFKSLVKKIMKVYIKHLPHSFVEEKEFSVVFHYRNTDLELASLKIAELINDLLPITKDRQLNLVLGDKVVEVRPSGIDKGVAANIFLKDKNYDFILAVGDDTTDEDLFKALPENAITVKVGMGKSMAKYSAKSYLEVRNLIEYLVK